MKNENARLFFEPEMLSMLEGRKVFCSFSGGSDSLALLVSLKAYSEEVPFTLTAVHFDHGIRGDASMQDALECGKVCQELSIPHTIKKLYVPSSKLPGEGDESAARRLRLESWKEIITEPENSVIALGHNSGDRIENLFIRLFRGSNSTGLTSMRPIQKLSRLTFARPLLNYSKSQIEYFLKNETSFSKWCIDSTNMDSKYQRNFIRNDILPAIDAEIPYALQGILHSLRNLQEDAAALEGMASVLFEELKATRAVSDTKFWLSIHNAVRSRLLRLFISDAIGSDFVPDSNLIERFNAELAASNADPSSGEPIAIPLKDTPDFFISIEKSSVFMRKHTPPSKETTWNWRETPSIIWGLFELTAHIDDTKISHKKSGSMACFFDASYVPDAFIIKEWEHGEKMVPFGKKTPILLKKLFSDAKISAHDKNQIPVLHNSETQEIVWIPGVKNSNFAPVSDDSELILVITALKKQFD